MSDVIERLRAANPLQECPPPSIEDVWRRLAETSTADEAVAKARSAAPERRRRRLDLATVAAGVSALVVVAMFVGALALLHRGGAAGDTSASSPRGLIARLAVLRRPQTPADRLPSNVKLSRSGEVIPGL